jgi:hypothetical protein
MGVDKMARIGSGAEYRAAYNLLALESAAEQMRLARPFNDVLLKVTARDATKDPRGMWRVWANGVEFTENANEVGLYRVDEQDSGDCMFEGPGDVVVFKPYPLDEDGDPINYAAPPRKDHMLAYIHAERLDQRGPTR